MEALVPTIVDRYDPVNLVDRVPKRLVDVEPERRARDRLLADDAIRWHVTADLPPRSGRVAPLERTSV